MQRAAQATAVPAGAVAAGLRRQRELLRHLTRAQQDRLNALLRQALAPLEDP